MQNRAIEWKRCTIAVLNGLNIFQTLRPSSRCATERRISLLQHTNLCRSQASFIWTRHHYSSSKLLFICDSDTWTDSVERDSWHSALRGDFCLSHIKWLPIVIMTCSALFWFIRCSDANDSESLKGVTSRHLLCLKETELCRANGLVSIKILKNTDTDSSTTLECQWTVWTLGPSLNYVFNSLSETKAETEGFCNPPPSLTDTLEEVVKSCRCNPPRVRTDSPSGSRTRDSGVGGGRSTKEAKGYSL